MEGVSYEEALKENPAIENSLNRPIPIEKSSLMTLINYHIIKLHKNISFNSLQKKVY